MAPSKALLGGAGAAGVLGVRLARTLHARWRGLSEVERDRLEPLAEAAKAQALELRGASDRAAAERDLHAANESLAAAIVDSAEADPELGEVEVSRLRDELRRELERLANGEVRAARGPAARAERRE